jgi:hypothetical protein
VWRVLRIKRGRVDRVVFPPEQVAEVKAVACEPPAKDAPLSRRSVTDVHRLVFERGISEASVSTVVRWLREDAILPGGSAPGFSRSTRSSRSRRAGFLICTKGGGMVSCCIPAT